MSFNRSAADMVCKVLRDSRVNVNTHIFEDGLGLAQHLKFKTQIEGIRFKFSVSFCTISGWSSAL